MLWDSFSQHVASTVGAPASQVNLIAALLLAYPLASTYIRLPSSYPNLAHLFSIIVSTTFLVPLLGLTTGMLHLLFSCIGVYIIVLSLRGPNMPWIAFMFALGHLLYNHLQHYIYGTPATEIDVTITQMVLVMNLTTFAWNVHDGRQNPDTLDASQVATRLQHVPNPLAFFGYCFFFPAMLIGPSFDYTTYDSLVHHTIFQTPSPGTTTAQAKATAKRIPHGRRRVAYLHLVIGLMFLGVYSVYGGRASYSRILTPVWYTWNRFERFGFIQFAGIIARSKYYAVWNLSEGACILAGIGFNGYDPKTGRTLWNKVRNINIISIETAESFKALFDNWNCRTNVWLRDCVYKRLVKQGQKPGTMQSMATFLTSAIWHGVPPGYYFAFITAGLFTSLGRQLRHFVRPYFLPSASNPTTAPNSFPKWPYPNLAKRIYDVIGWFLVQINLNYTASAFILLTFRDSVTVWHRMGWYGHICIILAMTFFQAGGRRLLRKGLAGRETTTPPAPPRVTIPPPPQPEDESNSRDLRWVKHELDNPYYQDGGEGVHPDAGFVDRLVQGAETPGFQSPRSDKAKLL